jgi:hypothetical protein
VGPDPRDFDMIVSQPSLDLHLNLSECWPGCGTLMIDVSPWCLMTNQTDLDLLVVEPNGTSWHLPTRKTFTPPKFKVLLSFSNCNMMNYVNLVFTFLFRCNLAMV